MAATKWYSRNSSLSYSKACALNLYAVLFCGPVYTVHRVLERTGFLLSILICEPHWINNSKQCDAHAAESSLFSDIRYDGFLTRAPEGQRQPSSGKLLPGLPPGWYLKKGLLGCIQPQHVRVHLQAPSGRDTSPPGTYRARWTKCSVNVEMN